MIAVITSKGLNTFFDDFIADVHWGDGGGGGELHLKPTKFKHIFAVITFPSFLLCRYF